jgi:hypothetical protein
MAVLEPKLAILDETDSGLDIDALRIVADGVNAMRSPDRSFVVVTHYQRLLDYIVPDFVHVLSAGRIVKSGGKELALELEEKGYGWMRPARSRWGRSRMAQVIEKLQPWMAALDERPQDGPRWLQDLRTRAAATFADLGFPTTRDEEWRFTSVAPIAGAEFQPAEAAGVQLGEADLAGYVYANAPNRLVVVNGRFSPELSRVGALPPGVRAGSLASAVTEHPEAVQRYLGQLAQFNTRAFSALNTALAADGAYVYIPDGVVLEEPLQLLFVAAPAPAGAPLMASARTLVIAGDRSQARIVETYVGPRGSVYFTNAVTEVALGESAVLDHYKVQEESHEAFHVASMHVHAVRERRTSRRTPSRSAGGWCATTSTPTSTARGPRRR